MSSASALSSSNQSDPVHVPYPEGCPVIIRDLSDPRRPRFVPVNSSEPVPIENDFFKGVALIKMRPAKPEFIPPTYRSFFNENQRAQFEVSVQGKFQRKNRGVIFMGGELVNHMELPFFKRVTSNLFLKLARTFNSRLMYSFGQPSSTSSPSTSLPASSSASQSDEDCASESPRTDNSEFKARSVTKSIHKDIDYKNDQAHDSKQSLSPSSTSSSSSSSPSSSPRAVPVLPYTSQEKQVLFPNPSPSYLVVPLAEALDRLIVTPESEKPPVLGASMLPKNGPGFLDRKSAPATHIVNPNSTYSMSFFSNNWDFARWKFVNIPAMNDMNAADFWGDSPVRITAYELVPSAAERANFKGKDANLDVYFDPSLPHDADHKRFLMNFEIIHAEHHKRYLESLRVQPQPQLQPLPSWAI